MVVKIDFNNPSVEIPDGQHDTQHYVLIEATGEVGMPWILLKEFGGDRTQIKLSKDATLELIL